MGKDIKCESPVQHNIPVRSIGADHPDHLFKNKGIFGSDFSVRSVSVSRYCSLRCHTTAVDFIISTAFCSKTCIGYAVLKLVEQKCHITDKPAGCKKFQAHFFGALSRRNFSLAAVSINCNNHLKLLFFK